jgi:hypothetical protein
MIRRLFLAGSGLTFGAIAVLAVIAPDQVAAAYGFTLGSVDARHQFRAVFVGFWLALALWMMTAARRGADRRLQDLAGAAILLQALARLMSLALDGWPSERFVLATLGELLTAGAILLPRPTRPSTPSAPART